MNHPFVFSGLISISCYSLCGFSYFPIFWCYRQKKVQSVLLRWRVCVLKITAHNRAQKSRACKGDGGKGTHSKISQMALSWVLF